MTNMLLSISGILSTVLYIGLAIVVLLFMIMIHELGHYTAGKLLKFKINEFAIGFGKPIFSKTKANGEKFSLRLIPLGGFCAFEGEDEDKPDNPEAFNSQKPWKRLIVLFMGAFFNFLSAIIFSIIFLMSFGYNDKVQVKQVDVPAYVQEQNLDWFKKNDIICAVDGVETNFVYDNFFVTMIADYEAETPFDVTVIRDGKEVVLKNIQKSWFNVKTEGAGANALYALDGKNCNYMVKVDASTGRYQVYHKNKPDRTFTADENALATVEYTSTDGAKVKETFYVSENASGEITVSTLKIGVITQNYRYGFFEALGEGFAFSFKWAWKILMILGQLVTGQLSITNMGGTVTTVVTIAQVTQTNIASLLLLIPLISINLAVFNLLPFPALDGARMVFVFIEWIRKKPINRNVEGTIHFIGLIVLLAFVVLVDILHFVL